LKIAYIGSKGLPSKSGTERVVEALVHHLASQHEITVYCDTRYTPEGTIVEGVRLIRIWTIRGKYTQAASLFVISAVHALFSHYDLIHLNGIDASFILPILRLKYRVVTTAHGTPTRLRRRKWGKAAQMIISWMEYPFVYLSNFSTSVSLEDAVYLRARYKRNIYYIPNGVDDDIQVDLQEAGYTLNQAGLEPGNYIMFAAGRMDPTKGCHVLLEALNLIGNPTKLAVVGDLNQLPSYSSHLKEIANKNQVVFIPPISNKKILFGMIVQACFFIFPSITEAMSMMLLEAASLKAPIICSDIPENKIIMQDNVLYFHSEDSADLANQLGWAFNHPEEMSSLGLRASIFIKNSLTWEKIVEQYEKLYQMCGC
jgi:glycosyltransferase involved in cell wall biosynthesis